MCFSFCSFCQMSGVFLMWIWLWKNVQLLLKWDLCFVLFLWFSIMDLQSLVYVLCGCSLVWLVLFGCMSICDSFVVRLGLFLCMVWCSVVISSIRVVMCCWLLMRMRLLFVEELFCVERIELMKWWWLVFFVVMVWMLESSCLQLLMFYWYCC